MLGQKIGRNFASTQYVRSIPEVEPRNAQLKSENAHTFPEVDNLVTRPVVSGKVPYDNTMEWGHSDNKSEVGAFFPNTGGTQRCFCVPRMFEKNAHFSD